MILVFGSVNVDLVARAASIPRPGETVLSPGYERLFGGKGANQAVAAARASRSVAVAMAARVGDDAFGREATANLRANGVDVARVAAGAEPTGCAFVVVDARGENAITVASGANGALDVDEAAIGLGDGDVLVLQMEVPVAASLAAARRARAAGARVIWNFAPAPADLPAADLGSVLSASDVFVVNEREAVAAARSLDLPADDPDAAAAAIAAGRGPIVVLTAGSQGAVAIMPDGARHRAAAGRVEVVDTTGAGDAFVGVLAVEMAEHGDIRRGLGRACLAASLACERVGAQTGMPDRAALDLFAADGRPLAQPKVDFGRT